MTPRTVAHHVPLSVEFSRPFLPPGDLFDPGIKSKSPVSPALVGGFTTAPPGIFALSKSILNGTTEISTHLLVP